MPFTLIGTITLLKTEWQYNTDPLEGEYFRFKHSEAPNGGLYAIAQAVINEDGTIQLFDSQVLAYERGITDTLKLKKPGWATERRLGFKKLPKQSTLEEELRQLLLPGFLQAQPIDPFDFVRKSEWKIDIEVSDYADPLITVDLSAITTKLEVIDSKLDVIASNNTSSGSNTPSQSSPSTQRLTYSSDGDQNGIFYYLGTNRNVSAWDNPGISGAIELSASSLVDSSRNVNSTVDRASNYNFYTKNEVNQWLVVDLKSVKLKINRYSLRGWPDSSFNLRNWKFQASTDSVDWLDLDTQTNNSGIAADKWISLPINTTFAYRYFRLLQTGVNSSGTNHLTLGEWELYGEVEGL